MNVFTSAKSLFTLYTTLVVTPGVISTTHEISTNNTDKSAYVSSMTVTHSGTTVAINDEFGIREIILKELGRRVQIKIEYDEYQDKYFFIIPTNDEYFVEDYETMIRLDEILQDMKFRNKDITVLLGSDDV